MGWLTEYADRTARDAPLAPLTWYRLGGPARYLVRPTDADDLAILLRRATEEEIPVKVLGGGSNVLVRDDGFDGIVVRLDGSGFRDVRFDGERVTAGAGVDLMPLVRECSARGLSGLECLAGIPGTVGGAVRMNAGGATGTFGDVVEHIELVGRDGKRMTWSAKRASFGYRMSAVDDQIVLSATLGLRSCDPADSRRCHDEAFARKREAQPFADQSAGCVFKNPGGASAGALIDEAGLKGLSVGKASVSTRHANFIVARRGASAADVLNLVDMIRNRVRDVHGTELEVEIDIW